MVNASRAYNLLKEIGFTRLGGSEEELRAANIIIERLKEFGVNARTESFPVNASKVTKASLEVLEPYQKTYECSGYRGCEETPDKGLTLDLTYLESDHEVSLRQAKGKCVIWDSYVGLVGYNVLKKAKAAAYITASGDLLHDRNDLTHPEVRDYLVDGFNAPAVHVRAEDLAEMVSLGASKVRIIVKQERHERFSHNVVATIPGRDNETIVCTAHYDSVEYSTGVYDNGSGAVCLFEIAAHFAKHKPKHTVTLVWCGSEERGLLGSKAYVSQHETELENIKLCVNIDMIGTIMGKCVAVSTAEQSLVDYISYLGKEVGYPVHSSQGVYSSDSTPFADKGIPAVSFARLAGNSYGPIHNRWDTMKLMNEKHLGEDINFVCNFTSHMANAVVIPVPRTMPDNMKKELDHYMGRDQK
ncbi:MAG: Zn-dependent exopeptidase M28 [Erysipelotrichaceae bacterium]|nr:Zn-dependent exopeptidase M28 [Erysipelotrichaceae bacterium]